MANTCSVEGCVGKVVAHGWCSCHYQRWKAHGDPEAKVRQRAENGASLADRFWPKVAKGAPGACWEWQASANKLGYGRLNVYGKTMKAHRASWVIHYGEIPAGMNICHRCDNPRCVNPAHLFLGTQRDNLSDMLAKGRYPIGTRHHGAKLNPAAVVQMRAMRASGMRYDHIAEHFGVKRMTASNAIKGITWGHVT